MDFNPVILAIPIYFGSILLELIYEWVTGKWTYRLADSLSNISTGIVQQMLELFGKLITIGIYAWVFEHWAFFALPDAWWSFILMFVGVDFFYYWFHRKAHEVNIIWGGHVVHHQSEEYNLSVALRQSATSFLWSFPFYLPLAILGFSPQLFVLAIGFNLIYQFFIHTEHIKKLPGWIEYVFNTPSHHRVHHARDEKYLDKNYAGVFIIWDRMFGTFKKEEEHPHYGITTPLRSWNPVYANLIHYYNVARLALRSRSWQDVKQAFAASPNVMSKLVSSGNTVVDASTKYSTYASKSTQVYVFVQFLLLLGVTAYFLLSLQSFKGLWLAIGALYITLSTVTLTWLLTYIKKWVITLEIIRLIGFLVILYLFLAGDFNLF